MSDPKHHACVLGALCALILPIFPAVSQDRDKPEVPAFSDYLPEEYDYDPAAPTPESVLGWPFAAWHMQHHELITYLKALDEWSDRITITEYARSHGRRPLIALAVTSPENHQSLEDIRQRHLDSITRAFDSGQEAAETTAPAQEEQAAAADQPLILWMGYGIHGDEPSASQAAVVLAYHLAAARSPEVAEFLQNTVVWIDPCLNPDGMERFASWTNHNRGQMPSAERADREHVQEWPGGRFNYYWFDMNRDWLTAVHPESQGRLKIYHQWKPHFVADYHEMGNVNRTYFFQPGIPEMVNPLTPERNQTITARIADYLAQSLDERGSVYYTRESFDDFYIGKGSTYPDLTGSVGILYEQASSRGFHQGTEYGRLTFSETIHNQVSTTLATLRAAQDLRADLIDNQHTFHRESASESAAGAVKAHVVSSPGDAHRLEAFRQMLDRHQIRYQALADDLTVEDVTFTSGTSLVIPTHQPQFTFLTALFEKRTQFDSTIFYDVSAWHLPSAYGLLHAELSTLPATAETLPEPPSGTVSGSDQPVAYLLPWEPHTAPAALWRLLREEVKVWVAQRPIVTGSGDEATTYPHGTLIVPVKYQEQHDATALRTLMEEIAEQHDLSILAAATSLGGGGIDLGSPSLKPVRKPQTLLVAGPGVSATAAGDIWYHFDQVWQTPLTRVEPHRITAALLKNYNTLILNDTPLTALPTEARNALENWVAQGGTLVAIGNGTPSVASLKWVNVASVEPRKAEEAKPKKDSPSESSEKKDEEEKSSDKPAGGKSTPSPIPHPGDKPYDQEENRKTAESVRGIVTRAWFDATHPLAYGYHRQGGHIALMKANTVYFQPSSNHLHNPLVYSEDPLVSGMISERNLEALRGSTPIQITAKGSGRVVLLTDNPVFRGHWLGSSKLLANAIFFAPLVNAVEARADGSTDSLFGEEADEANE